MLVQASTYRDYLPTTSNVSVYADVPATAQYASSIRIAAEQNWVTGYLGGLYKPDQPITMQEAARGIIALLGYTSEGLWQQSFQCPHGEVLCVRVKRKSGPAAE